MSNREGWLPRAPLRCTGEKCEFTTLLGAHLAPGTGEKERIVYSLFRCSRSEDCQTVTAFPATNFLKASPRHRQEVGALLAEQGLTLVLVPSGDETPAELEAISHYSDCRYECVWTRPIGTTLDAPVDFSPSQLRSYAIYGCPKYANCRIATVWPWNLFSLEPAEFQQAIFAWLKSLGLVPVRS